VLEFYELHQRTGDENREAALIELLVAASGEDRFFASEAAKAIFDARLLETQFTDSLLNRSTTAAQTAA
jgi:hypothetical protein